MSTQRISTLVCYSLGVELTFQLFQSLLPSADKLQVGQSQLDLILEKNFPVHGSQAADHLISPSCYSRPEVSQIHFPFIQLCLEAFYQIFLGSL